MKNNSDFSESYFSEEMHRRRDKSYIVSPSRLQINNDTHTAQGMKKILCICNRHFICRFVHATLLYWTSVLYRESTCVDWKVSHCPNVRSATQRSVHTTHVILFRMETINMYIVRLSVIKTSISIPIHLPALVCQLTSCFAIYTMVFIIKYLYKIGI